MSTFCYFPFFLSFLFHLLHTLSGDFVIALEQINHHNFTRVSTLSFTSACLRILLRINGTQTHRLKVEIKSLHIITFLFRKLKCLNTISSYSFVLTSVTAVFFVSSLFHRHVLCVFLSCIFSPRLFTLLISICRRKKSPAEIQVYNLRDTSEFKCFYERERRKLHESCLFMLLNSFLLFLLRLLNNRSK